MTNHHERRQFTRMKVQCPVKLYLPKTRRYRAGCTSNFSAGGAMLELFTPTNLVPGERIEMALDPLDHRKLYRTEDLRTATVIRTVGDGHGVQKVAVQFEQVSDIPDAQAA